MGYRTTEMEAPSPSRDLTNYWKSYADRVTLSYLTSFGYAKEDWDDLVNDFESLDEIINWVALLSLVDQIDDTIKFKFSKDDKGVPFLVFSTEQKIGEVKLKVDECVSLFNFFFANYVDGEQNGMPILVFKSNDLCLWTDKGLSGYHPSWEYGKLFNCRKGLPFDIKETPFTSKKIRFHHVAFEGQFIYNIAVV